ncbi:MAG TPA: lysyl oxidase family protein [Candidatus Limnocylindria bacterium]|nr:lysyl oxidase family protein [Candidatus Limnocylindria bacterium]
MAAKRMIGTLALATALLALPVPVAAADAPNRTVGATDVLPDLKMAPIYDVSLQYLGNGKVRLRFGTTMWNIGQGPLEARGTGRVKRHMDQIRQVIYATDGSTRSVTPPDVTGFYAGDGHNHWHLLKFVAATLYPAGNAGGAPSAVRVLHKIGFCLTDSQRVPVEVTPANAAPKRTYPYTGCGTRDSQKFKMGISVGWADVYPAWIAHQWVEVTGLAAGDYRLCATPNPLGQWLESDLANNSAWIDVRINVATKQLTILGQGDTECQPAADAALAAARVALSDGPPAAIYCPIEGQTTFERLLNQL